MHDKFGRKLILTKFLAHPGDLLTTHCTEGRIDLCWNVQELDGAAEVGAGREAESTDGGSDVLEARNALVLLGFGVADEVDSLHGCCEEEKEAREGRQEEHALHSEDDSSNNDDRRFVSRRLVQQSSSSGSSYYTGATASTMDTSYDLASTPPEQSKKDISLASIASLTRVIIGGN